MMDLYAERYTPRSRSWKLVKRSSPICALHGFIIMNRFADRAFKIFTPSPSKWGTSSHQGVTMVKTRKEKPYK